MKTIWNDAERRDIQDRLRNLRPEARGRWGRMTVDRMVAHLSDGLRMSMGELPCAPRPGLLRYTPIKQLIIFWAPFPKGAPTAPEILRRVPVTWSGEIDELAVLIDRVARLPGGFVWPEHPAFGSLSRQAWGVLIYRHLDHHLRQFGA